MAAPMNSTISLSTQPTVPGPSRTRVGKRCARSMRSTCMRDHGIPYVLSSEYRTIRVLTAGSVAIAFAIGNR